jgi:uncharacterized membrane protein
MVDQAAPPAGLSAQPDSRAGSRFDPLSAAARFWTSLVVAGVVELALPRLPGFPGVGSTSSIVGGDWLADQVSWDVFFVVYLALTWRLFRRDPPERIWARATRGARSRSWLRRRVVRSRVRSWLVFLVASVAVYAAAWVLPRAETLAPDAPGALRVLSAGAVILSWFVVHVVYAERYAAMYYRERGGLDFSGEQAPDYLDFAYFSFSIGMTFGTTDVDVTSRSFRRAMLGHKLFSFGFNTAILALVLTILFQ